MKKILVVTITLFMLAPIFTTILYAATGEVVFRQSSCPYYFIVHVTDGDLVARDTYSVLKWTHGYLPVKGDVISGKIDEDGPTRVQYPGASPDMDVSVRDDRNNRDLQGTASSNSKVIIIDKHLTKEQAVKIYEYKCK